MNTFLLEILCEEVCDSRYTISFVLFSLVANDYHIIQRVDSELVSVVKKRKGRKEEKKR